MTVAVVVLWWTAAVLAHSGPPFPIVSNRIAGGYQVSIWTDPDATDDGTRGGQFWVTLASASGADVPNDTRVRVTIRPADRPTAPQAVWAEPVDGHASRQFAALLMDHEGRFAVEVTVSGSLGSADVASEVDATYDLRPAPWLLVVYLLPFVATAAIWVKLLRRRRGPRR